MNFFSRSVRASGLVLGLLALAATAPAAASLFGDDEARKAILELRDKLAESDKQHAARLDEITKRLEQLEARVEALQHGVSESANRFDTIEADIAKLRGVSEQLANDLATKQKHDRELFSDFDQRLRKVEPQSVTVDGRTAPVDHDEQAAYDSALALFRGSDYRSAINSLRAFLARYPQSVYAPAAQFWLGSSLYAVKDFAGAVAAQQALLERFPDSPRAAEALLNLGASQLELNDRKSARQSFSRIVSDYPDSEAARLARERLASLGPDEKGAERKKAKAPEAKAEH